jgi:sporulation protein YlmC with PRC-barrel domain
MSDDSIHLLRDVVDHEVVDVHQLPCGIVDDIEVEFDLRRGFRPVALLIGPGAWQRRLSPWLARIARRIAGSEEIRVPWSQIAYIGERVALRSRAVELGLGASDRKWGKRIERVPGA